MCAFNPNLPFMMIPRTISFQPETNEDRTETENNESFLFFTMFAFWLECVISEMFMVSKVI